MSFLGLAVSVCSQMSISNSLKLLNACNKSGIKLVDKYLIPFGTFCVSCYVGDKVGEHVENNVKEAKEKVKESIALCKDIRNGVEQRVADEFSVDNRADQIFHNVFDGSGSDDKPQTDVEEEVDANGNS